MGNKSLIENIDSYIEKCFVDAYASSGRKYDINGWKFEYVLLTSSLYKFKYLIPISCSCEQPLVLKKVNFRLRRNLYRNMGIMFDPVIDSSYFDKNGDEIFSDVGFIVSNSYLNTKNAFALVNITDRKTNKTEKYYLNSYHPGNIKRYSQMLDHYWKLNPENNNEELYIDDWDEFVSFYREVYNSNPWDNYTFTFSATGASDIKFSLEGEENLEK